MPPDSSPSTSRSPAATNTSRQNPESTAEKVTRYTILSSLTGAIFTALYESSIGRARAIRALEASGGGNTNANANVNGNAHGLPTGNQTGQRSVGADVTKFYRHNTALLSASAALNSGLVAFAFFSLREHVISPSLTGARQRSSEGSEVGDSSRQLTWSAMRMHHVEDTALTGAILGGMYNAWKKGPKGLVPGVMTASLACTALQLIVNEIDVQRIRYISRVSSLSSTPTPASPTNSLSGDPNNNGSRSKVSASFTPNGPASSAPIPRAPAAPSEEATGPSLGERMLTLIGITKVDDEEYLRRLKAKREIHLARIRELEKQVEEERRRKGDTDGNGVGDGKGDDSDTTGA